MYLPPHDPQFLLGPQLSVLVPAFCFDALSRLDPSLQAAGAAHAAPLGRIAAAGAAALRVRAVQLKMATEALHGHCRWLLDGVESSEEQVMAAFAAADQRAQAEFRRVSLVITGKRMPSGLASAGRFKAYLGCMVSDAIALRQAGAGWLVRSTPHSAYDSGWMVYQEGEDLDQLYDRDGEWPLTVDQLLHLQPVLEDLLWQAPIGSELRWHEEFGQWFFERPELGDWEPVSGGADAALEALLSHGLVVAGLLLPQTFGGRLDVANVCWLPQLAWRAKQEFEADLESRMNAGLEVRYAVDVVPGEVTGVPERLHLRAEVGGSPLESELVTRTYKRWGGL